MNFDLRLPIGIMFSLFGGILTVFGLLSDPTLYASHSLGININLIWGLVLLVFGICMLVMALRANRKPVGSVEKPGATKGAPENLKR